MKFTSRSSTQKRKKRINPSVQKTTNHKDQQEEKREKETQQMRKLVK